VSSAMGFILLIGLVVKNGIVMIDYAHHLQAAGKPFAEAVAEAARIRLRPILMTTLCTLFGLLPLALGLGAGAELQKPLALVVIGGLSLSTRSTWGFGRCDVTATRTPPPRAHEPARAATDRSRSRRDAGCGLRRVRREAPREGREEGETRRGECQGVGRPSRLGSFPGGGRTHHHRG